MKIRTARQKEKSPSEKKDLSMGRRQGLQPRFASRVARPVAERRGAGRVSAGGRTV